MSSVCGVNLELSGPFDPSREGCSGCFCVCFDGRSACFEGPALPSSVLGFGLVGTCGGLGIPVAKIVVSSSSCVAREASGVR